MPTFRGIVRVVHVGHRTVLSLGRRQLLKKCHHALL